MMHLKVFRVSTDVIMPAYATERSACFDIRAHIPNTSKIVIYDKDNNTLNSYADDAFKPYSHLSPRIDGQNDYIEALPGERLLIPTGLIFDITPGYSVRIHSRSGLALKSGIALANGEGVIDEDYVHETFVMVRNYSTRRHRINNGDKIAQGEIVLANRCIMIDSSTKPDQKTDRIGGFGSTGRV